jgi:hypothetical protein
MERKRDKEINEIYTHKNKGGEINKEWIYRENE